MSRSTRLLVLVALLGASIAVTRSSAASAQTDTITEPASCCARAERIDPPVPPRRAHTVGLVGDSLSVGITDDRFQFGPTFQALLFEQGRAPWFHTTVSMNLPAGRESLFQRRPTVGRSDVIVVALGTNDIVGTPDPTTLRPAIDAIVDEILGANHRAHIVWVDLAFPRLSARAHAFNTVLDDVAARDSGIHRCRWSDAIAANPGWYGADGVHLTGTGYDARRDVVLACVDAIDVARSIDDRPPPPVFEFP